MTININIKELIKDNEKQKLCWEYFFEHPETIQMLYGGAAGAGKSYIIALIAIIGCLKYEDTFCLIGRNTLQNLKESTLITIFEVLKKLNIENVVNYNAKDMRLYFPNGSIISLYDLSYSPGLDPEVSFLGSVNVSFAMIDEINGIHPKIYKTLLTRIGRKNKNGQPIKILSTCNPSKSFIYEEFYIPYREFRLTPDKVFIQALPEDNRKYLGEKTYNYYQSLTGYEREVFVLGNWEYDSNELQIIQQQKIDELFTNTFLKTENNTYRLVCDPARFGKDNATIGLFKDNELFEIWKKNKTSIPDIINKINEYKEQYDIINTNIVIDSDGVGGGVADAFIGCKNFHGGGKSHKKYKNKRHECYFKLADKINNNKLYCSITDISIVTPLKQELSHIIRDDKSDMAAIISKENIKKIIGRSTDLADLLMMFQVFDTNNSSGVNFVFV